MKMLPIGCAAIFICIAGCGRSSSDIAVVDIEKVFQKYDKSRKIYESLEKEKGELEAKGQKMLDEINALVKESEILSEEAKKEREKRIKEKTEALEAYQVYASRELMGKTSAEYEKLMVDVRAVAESVAKRNGVSLIMDSSAVVYRKDSLDITLEIVEELNKRCKEEHDT
jgi:Skp family chaperone for outer membrane proteins